MSQPAKLTTQRCLMIFDMHQDVEWVEAILKREDGNFSHLLLGGDYFDVKSEHAANIPEVCDLLNRILEDFAGRLTVLLGNHDTQYFEGRRSYLKFRSPKNENYRICGYSKNKGKAIAKHLNHAFLDQLRLFQFINGFLVSHAGIAEHYWAPFKEHPDPIALLEKYCSQILKTYPTHYHPFLAAGIARGGTEPVGGIVWQDWDEEFSDSDIPFPQIVGHTSAFSGARQKGRSWCLDGRQTCYGLLDQDGILEVKKIRRTDRL